MNYASHSTSPRSPYAAHHQSSSSYASSSGGWSNASTSTAAQQQASQPSSSRSVNEWINYAQDSKALDRFGAGYGLAVEFEAPGSASANNAMRFLRTLKSNSPEILAQNEHLLASAGREEDFRGRQLYPRKDVSQSFRGSTNSSTSPNGSGGGGGGGSGVGRGTSSSSSTAMNAATSSSSTSRSPDTPISARPGYGPQ